MPEFHRPEPGAHFWPSVGNAVPQHSRRYKGREVSHVGVSRSVPHAAKYKIQPVGGKSTPPASPGCLPVQSPALPSLAGRGSRFAYPICHAFARIPGMDRHAKWGTTLRHTLMGLRIAATGSYAPPNKVTNEDLAAYDLDPEWVYRRTGIRERRHAPPEMATSDLCAYSAEQCFERSGLSPADIDLLVVGTVSPDWHVASTAAVLQNRLGLRCGAIEVASACAGFMYALCTAAQYIATGAARRALVLGADCCSRVIDPKVPKTYLLFGDGGGGVILERGTPEQGLLAYTLGVEGAGAEQLYIPMGGSRKPASHEHIDQFDHLLSMDGKAVYKWATRVLSDSIEDVLEQAKLQLSDIDLFVPHQANLRIIEAAADHLGIDRDKILINVDRYGNTSGGSVPLALDEAYQSGRIKPGDKVLLSGYGAGLSWGTAIFAW